MINTLLDVGVSDFTIPSSVVVGLGVLHRIFKGFTERYFELEAERNESTKSLADSCAKLVEANGQLVKETRESINETRLLTKSVGELVAQVKGSNNGRIG